MKDTIAMDKAFWVHKGDDSRNTMGKKGQSIPRIWIKANFYLFHNDRNGPM